MKRIAIIGAGASGLMAAYAAGISGASVVIYEKNEKPGKKIYITGKGRCNVTNACEESNFFDNVIRNPKFMYKSFNSFTNKDLCRFLESNGTKVKVERGGRVFPVSNHASDVTRAFLRALEVLDVNLVLNKKVTGIIKETDENGDVKAVGVICENKKEYFDAVILAMGGATYPGAGGSRCGYKLCKDLGIKINEIRPSLVPFILNDDFINELQGLSLKNVSLRLKYNDKVIFEEFGEMLFTHFGISGPLVLTASSKVGDLIFANESIKASIDFKPKIPDDELDDRLIRIISEHGKKMYKSFYDNLLFGNLKSVAVKVSGIDPELRISDIYKKRRRIIFNILRDFPINITGLRGFEEAIITKGGVDVKEINPKTMECKNIKNLYVCGEMLDVDALTGGYNLQCAFSTGYVAGISAEGSKI